MTAAEKKEMLLQLEGIIARHKGKKGALMPVLQEAQSTFGYVPEEVQVAVAEGLSVPLSEVYGVTTFYSQFSLEPQGKYIVGVCMGTACYVKGSQIILDRLASEMDVKVGATTPDGLFTLNATRCLGACGLAPVIMINDDVYGRLTGDDIPGIIAKYKE